MTYTIADHILKGCFKNFDPIPQGSVIVVRFFECELKGRNAIMAVSEDCASFDSAIQFSTLAIAFFYLLFKKPSSLLNFPRLIVFDLRQIRSKFLVSLLEVSNELELC